MTPFIAPLREGGLKVNPEYDLRGENANPFGFCALYSYNYFGTKSGAESLDLTQPRFEGGIYGWTAFPLVDPQNAHCVLTFKNQQFVVNY